MSFLSGIYFLPSAECFNKNPEVALIIVLDNFDSFTYNLVDYLQQLRLEVQVLRNDVPLESIDHLPFKGIVLSPGPGIPSKAGIMPELIAKYHKKVPLLGICLGHQAIGEYFGAQLVRSMKPMHGKISEIKIKQDPIFENLPTNFRVTRYHSLILQHLPSSMEVIAKTEADEIMGIRHLEHPCYGVQYHPEACLTENGLELLANWARMYHLYG